MEHNSVNRVLARFELQGHIKIRHAHADQDGIIASETIQELINNNTRMIIINHASNVLGAIQDIERIGSIARDANVLFVVDASQTAGNLSISVKDCNIDILATSGHKSLLGPTGTGILYYGERCPEPKDGLIGLREGGSGSDSTRKLHPEVFPYCLEAGTANVVGLAGLDAGLDYINGKTINAIRKHELDLVDYVLKEFSKRNYIQIFGPKRESLNKKVGVVSFEHKDFTSHELSSIMDEHFNIALRSGLHCAPMCHKQINTFPDGLTRMSVGLFTTPEEVEYFVKSVIDIS